MNSEGNCESCPDDDEKGKCSWENHHSLPYEYVLTTFKKKVTSENMKRNYTAAVAGQAVVTKILNDLVKEFISTQADVIQKIQMVYKRRVVCVY